MCIRDRGEEDGEEYLDVVDDDEELYEVSDMFARRLEAVSYTHLVFYGRSNG